MNIRVLLLIGLFAFPIFSQQGIDCGEVTKRLADANKKLNDWPELSRYKEANEQVVPPKKGENRVVFMGDSITDLWDNDGFGGFFPGKPYIDRGIGGQTTPQMLLRFRQDVVDLKPKVVIIFAGTNDISGNTGPMTLQQTGDNIASMAEIAAANGIRVVIASVTPVSDTVKRADGTYYTQTKSRPPARIVEMNKWLKSYAETHRLTYLDYYSAMVDDKGFIRDGITFDGLHPNAKGYAIMTPLAEQAIKTALAKR